MADAEFPFHERLIADAEKLCGMIATAKPIVTVGVWDERVKGWAEVGTSKRLQNFLGMEERLDEKFVSLAQRYPVVCAVICSKADWQGVITILSPFVCFTLAPELTHAAALADRRALQAVSFTEERTGAMIAHQLRHDV